MEIPLASALEAKLNRIASETRKESNQEVQELVANYLDHNEWFKQEVEQGIASLDSGKFISHEEVRRQTASSVPNGASPEAAALTVLNAVSSRSTNQPDKNHSAGNQQRDQATHPKRLHQGRHL